MEGRNTRWPAWSLCILLAALHPALAGGDWFDSFYPYRVPITVDVPSAGEFRLELTAERITRWINEEANFQFNPRYFGYNTVKLVEIDEREDSEGRELEAGFCICVGPELVANGNFEQRENEKPVGWQIGHEAFRLQKASHDGSWCMTTVGADRHGCAQNILTRPNHWYRFSCRVKGPAAVNVHYTPKGGWWRVLPHTYHDPYVPERGWYPIEYYFHTGNKADWETDQVQVRMERYTGSADDVSVRPCRVAFVLKADRPGTKRCLLYYSPVEANSLVVPEHHVATIPKQSLAAEKTGEAEYLDHDLRYAIVSNSACDLWYASTLKKVFEREPPPETTRETIRFAAARNESEAVQLVLRPKADGQIRRIDARLSGPLGYTLPNDCFDVRRAEYVTIKTPSSTGAGYREVSRSAFTGRLPDPLPKLAPLSFRAGDPNVVIWVDVRVPKDAPAGLYQGEIVIDALPKSLRVPWELRVWDFCLPDRPTCRTAFQFSRYANQYLFPFHKIGADKKDRYELSRAYIAEMARYKITARSPQSAGTWDPDRETLGPFGSEEKELSWALDELHVTGFGIGHFSGPSLGDETVESAAETAERYDEMAEFLQRKGWLEYAYIQIDEPQPVHYQGVRNWIEAFRRRPHAKDIRMFIFVYSGQCYDALSDCADILVPENNDGGNAVSPAAIARWPEDKEVWCYWTNTAHQWIDSPNINPRLWSPKTWWLGARGMATWAITLWWSESSSVNFENPWSNPHTPWGNGVLAYFYPPDPKGRDLPERNLTIVPSMRLVLTRDGIEDYEYAVLLERALAAADPGTDEAAAAGAALAAMRRPFRSPVSWTLGEVHWQQTRASAAQAIERLKGANEE